MDELRGFHTAFRACFARQEPRDQFFNYMVGQFSALERKSIEPMALQVEGGKVRAMQRLVSEALWDEAAMLETYHRLLQDEMGEPDGVLIVDETGFVKKGDDSVGVARQYCGSLGKVENCQVGVFAAYASRQGYALVDKRLFLPEFEDHSTHIVGPHGKSKRYKMVVRRVYLGVSEGCGRAVDRQDTRRGLHPELFEVGRHVRRQTRALHHGEPVGSIADGLDFLQGQP